MGTAGHIDHGKTSLVRLLTGRDLDTLPEEKARGITIQLGFAPLDLPDGGRIALVDVPGHERLVRTMIAGATGLDAVILVVSALDGVMPQTREHLGILELLGVRHGLIALTMIDRVDEELFELAREDVLDLVRGTFLEGTPLIPVSAVDGRGRDGLLGALATLPARERRGDGPFRLPVDRAFGRTGFGTVVTGTSASGVLEDGASVTLLPAGTTARVRGIEVHGQEASAVGAGARVALNLAGVELDAVPRGTVIARGDVPCPRVIDVTYTHLRDAGELVDGASVRVLLGTAEGIGRIYAAAEIDAVAPGWTGPAQVRLDTELPCLPGDRFVVRLTSPVRTLGGGVVVDPWAGRMRARDRAAWGAQITRLADGDRAVWLERAGDAGLSLLEASARDVEGERLGDRVLAPSRVERLESVLLTALDAAHAETPLRAGIPRRELRRDRLAHLPDRVFDALLERLVGRVELDGPSVRRAGFVVGLGPEQAGLQARIAGTLATAGLEGVKPADLHASHPEPEVAALIKLLEEAGRAQQVPALGWVDQAALDGLIARVQGWFATHDVLGPGEMKELTGLTRRAAIPLLEWLDKQRWTAPAPDGRRGPGPRVLPHAPAPR